MRVLQKIFRPTLEFENAAYSCGFSKIAGIDEAGRGPIVGPLVMAGVSVTEDKIETLKAMGIKDSKLIPPARREELFDEIIRLVDSYDIIEISASEIDDYQDRGINLNKMVRLFKNVKKIIT